MLSLSKHMRFFNAFLLDVKPLIKSQTSFSPSFPTGGSECLHITVIIFARKYIDTKVLTFST